MRRIRSSPSGKRASVAPLMTLNLVPKLTIACSFQSLMMTLVKLKDQREQAALDLKRLENERRKAEEDPQTFVSTLLSKREILPRRQVPAPVPTIDFETYEKLPIVQGGAAKPEPPPKPVKRAPASTSTSSAPKSSSHSSPWTIEEQHRLEQLLIEYPDEPVAAYRWEKIARALGRTPKQVVSRVHRYFERLARAGLPVPGRLPASASKANTKEVTSSRTSTSTSSTSHRQPKQYNWYEAPVVKMDAILPVIDDSTLLSEEEKRAFAGLETTEEYKELIRLKRFKKFQEQSHERYVHTTNPTEGTHVDSAGGNSTSLPNATQLDSQCSSCHASPIIGRNYRCVTCTRPKVSLCSSCFEQGGFKTDQHLPTHSFDVEQSAQFVDADYALTDDMAYLDPNYMGN